MELKEILQECRKLGIHRSDYVDYNYIEIIIATEHNKNLHEILTKFFGPPEKPSGIPPTLDHLRLTQYHGGIRENQELFKKEDAENITIAMLWPWRDGIYTTLKAAIL